MYKRSKKKEKGPKLKVIMSPYIGSKEDPVIKVKNFKCTRTGVFLAKAKFSTVIHLQSSSYLLKFMKNSFIGSPEKDILIQSQDLARRQVRVW